MMIPSPHMGNFLRHNFFRRNHLLIDSFAGFIFYLAGQSSALTPALTLAALLSHAGSSASPDLTEDPGNEVPQRTPNPAGRDETSTQTAAVATAIKGAAHSESETATNAVYKTHLLTTSSALAPLQHTNAPAAMTAHPGAPSPSGNQDRPACTVDMPLF